MTWLFIPRICCVFPKLAFLWFGGKGSPLFGAKLRFRTGRTAQLLGHSTAQVDLKWKGSYRSESIFLP